MTSSIQTQKITLAPWVAWRMYRTACESRCFISNERLRTYLLLTDASAELFDAIAQGSTTAELHLIADNLGVDDELDVFIASLEQELLLNTSAGIEAATAANTTLTPEILDIEQEMITWAGSNGFLYSFHIDLTYRCNQACLHCYNPEATLRRTGGFTAAAELTTAEIITLLDQLVKLGVFRIIFSGGEATLRPDLLEILRAARKRGFCVELYSNGLGFTDSFVGCLHELGIHKVSLSLYSHQPQQHDRVTGISGSWEQTVHSFKLLKQYGMQTACKSIPMRDTIDGYFETKRFCAALADSVSMDMSLSAGYGNNQTPLELQPTEEQMADVFRQEIRDGRLKKQAALDLNQPPCGAGRKSLCIGPDGNIYPCTGFPYPLGNIRHDDLSAIWHNGSAGSGFLATWRQATIADFEECGSHDYCDYCPEVCAGAAWLATGNYLAASQSSCRQARAYQSAASSMNSESKGGVLNGKNRD